MNKSGHSFDDLIRTDYRSLYRQQHIGAAAAGLQDPHLLAGLRAAIPAAAPSPKASKICASCGGMQDQKHRYCKSCLRAYHAERKAKIKAYSMVEIDAFAWHVEDATSRGNIVVCYDTVSGLRSFASALGRMVPEKNLVGVYGPEAVAADIASDISFTIQTFSSQQE